VIRTLPVTLPMDQIVDGLNRIQPHVLMSYPSALLGLAHETAVGRLRITPRRIKVGAEPLLPEIRQAAEEAWGVPVLNVYGASEAGGLGVSCGHGPGLHLVDDLVIVEPVDNEGRPVGPGERSAKLYVTNLFNTTLPLIRYEVTDEITLTGEPCPCGSAHRVITDPQGRLDETFRYGDLAVASTGQGLVASCTVTNDGPRPGAEVVQLYVGPSSKLDMTQPRRALAGYEKVWLDPGESRQVRIQVDERPLRCWDAASHRWVAGTGERSIWMGSSSRDLRLQATVTV
jgi:hypothetical protein